MPTIENEHLNCMKTVSCKVTTIENQKGYRGHHRALWAARDVGGEGGYVGSVRGHQGCRGVRGVLRADKNSRFSGARRGIGASVGIGCS